MSTSATEVLKVGSISLDTATCILIGPFGSVKLRKGTYSVLRALMLARGETIGLSDLVQIGGGLPEQASRHVVLRCRKAILRVSGDSSLLRNEYGIGYALGATRKSARSFAAWRAALVEGRGGLSHRLQRS